jgi:hypothetical protein
MTIKISQLANLTVVQANTVVPVVSNITGTLTTVKGNVEQLQTYMLENAGNLIPRAGNIYSIGNSTTWWKDLWLSANTLYIGGVPIGTSGGSLTFGGNVVGTSDLPTYTGPVSANAVSVGATTVFGNITTLPTMSIDGDTGNVTASDISTTGSLLTGGDITTTGDISTTGAVTTGDVSFALSPAGAVNVLGFTGVSGTLYTPGRIYETTTDGAGSGLRVLVTYVEYGPGSARSLPSPSGGTIKIIDGGSGYLDGDVVYVQHYGDEQGGITATLQAQSVTGAPVTSGTITANTSVWSFDESGDTTVPGNIVLPDNTEIYNVDADTAVFTSNSISDTTSIYLTDAGNAAVYASDSVVLETNSDGNVSQQWVFNADGSITFPDGGGISPDGGQTTFFGSDGNNAAFGQYDQLNQVYTQPTDVSVQTSTDGNVYYTWSYDTEGNLALPAGEISTLANNDLYIGADSGQAVRIAANSGAKAWNFNSNGSVIFPDNTLQTSAYPGQIYGNTQVNTYLPTYSGNIGQLLTTSNLTVFGSITAGFAFPTATFANVIFNGGGLANSYAQLNIQNVDSVGTQNSADFIATAPNGTDTSRYIDMGINGNNYSSSSWTVSGANDGYVYINSGNLTLGTDTPNTTVKVHVGGTLAGNVVTTFSNSNVTICGNLIVCNVYVPTANNSVGTTGQISYDSSYVYICIATNTWKRANISTW